MKNQKNEYILLAEAEKLTGKSRTTLNRLANQNPEQTKRENHKFLISKEFLLTKYPEKINQVDNHKINHEQTLINQLRTENEYLRDQNRKLLEIVANLRLTKDEPKIKQRRTED